jgi:hypothetical protein
VCFRDKVRRDRQANDGEAQVEKVDGLPCSGTISIGPYTVVIYSQDQSEFIRRRMWNATSGCMIALKEAE